jgi:hypothetical protein
MSYRVQNPSCVFFSQNTGSASSFTLDVHEFTQDINKLTAALGFHKSADVLIDSQSKNLISFSKHQAFAYQVV